MPKGKDSLGIKYEGAVLTGRKSVREGLSGSCVPDLGRPQYVDPADYDAVLLRHCRLRW